MAKINALKPEVYNLIAAGEVIETPAGAVKELVENSIDAGAKRIVIEVEQGGFKLISVTDNGCGISEQDVELAFAKYATSKLQYADDLFAVQTLGFRGEALSSIAAVSRIKMTTRTNGCEVGTQVQFDAGKLIDKKQVSANVGTKIEVRDIFYNTPVRQKFFKSPTREGMEITKYVAKLILCNPNLEILYNLDGETVYSTKGNGLEEAIFVVYGSECISQCLRVAYSRNGVMIMGYVGNPEYTKPNRKYQTLSVNGRCITDQNISGAIMQAYKPYLMTHKYPFYVLDIEIPCDAVDVNVHPKKQEVRFVKPNYIFGSFYNAVTKALEEYKNAKMSNLSKYSEGSELASKYTAQEFLDKFNSIMEKYDIEIMNEGQSEDVKAVEQSTDEADRKKRFEMFADELEREVTVAKARQALGLDGDDNVHQVTYNFTDYDLELRESAKTPEEIERNSLYLRTRILGAAFKTYLILELDDNIIFVDQHAAHERILFDNFMEHKSQDMQQVLLPYVFGVSDEEAAFIEDNKENILAAGIEVENFGPNSYRIIAVSTLLEKTDMQKFVDFLLESTDEFKLDDRTLIVQKIAQMACKAAVKAGYTLNEYEIKYIIQQVYHNKIMQCPHGRPITVVFTKKQIEKMFKRIV